MKLAQSHRRKQQDRSIRTAKLGSAKDAIGKLGHGDEIFILTFGQFSLLDAVTCLLEQTGPADVVISTWTAANADLSRTAKLVECAQIQSLRMVVDRSFLTRQPDYCAHMRRLFGDQCIRTARLHSKFVVIHNAEWKLAIRTSMNLNENPRLENLEISDDPRLCSFLLQVCEDIFSEQKPGVFNAELPLLGSAPDVQRRGVVKTGKVGRLDRAKIG